MGITGMNTIISVPVPLTCVYKKNSYPLSAGVHLQYLFLTHYDKMVIRMYGFF